jgi:3-hydroxyisobutyrate dehydrogenase-like beta-hydroxyacid dehydrogenase
MIQQLRASDGSSPGDARNVGVIGTGTMGAAMVRRLLAAGRDVYIHDRRRKVMDDLRSEGATPVDSVTELTKHCRLILTSLPGPAELEEVSDELLASIQPGDVHVGHSTVSIECAQRVEARTRAAGGMFLDAPVSGGPMGVAAGTLSIMASGDSTALEAARPYLEAYAGTIFELGQTAGTGTLAKLINNAIFLCSGLVYQEAVVLATKAGMDASVVDTVLGASSASLYLGLAGPTLSRDWDHDFYSVGLAEKDVALALDAGRSLAVPMPVISAAHQHYLRARALGLTDKICFATLAAVEQAAGVTVPARPAPANHPTTQKDDQ